MQVKRRLPALALALALAVSPPGLALEMEGETAPEEAKTSGEETVTVVSTGSCGKDSGDAVVYTLYSDGSLVISGNGALKSTWDDDLTITMRSECVRLVVGPGVTSLNGCNFQLFSNLERVEIQGQMSLGNDVFAACKGLRQAELRGVTGIGARAFDNCAALEKVVLGEGLTSIEMDAFYGCKSLENVEFPSTLESIGIRAFQNCDRLTRVELPESVKTLGANAFRYCDVLTEVRIPYDLEIPADTFPDIARVELYGRELIPAAALTASRSTPVGSSNIHGQIYSPSSQPIGSYLFAGEGGGFYRVDYDAGRSDPLVMEEYGGDGMFLRGWSIPMEGMELFGGFYNGSDGYYFVFGQRNPAMSDSVETVRVVKYTRKLERLGEASLYGGNTICPFSDACLRMDGGNGVLYIYTGHTLYVPDRPNYNGHQANMLLAVDTESMVFRYKGTDQKHPLYASHSVNQFIKYEDGRLLTVSHGDTYPRALDLVRISAGMTDRDLQSARLMTFPGSGIYTNTSAGGFEISDSGYLTAVSTSQYSSSGVYNAYLYYLSRTGETSFRVNVSGYPEENGCGASTPQLVKISGNRFALLWEEQLPRTSAFDPPVMTNGVVKLAFFDGEGKQTGAVRKISGALSDCQPVLMDGCITWYVTENGGTPAFYRIPVEGVSAFAMSDGSVSVLDAKSVLAGCDAVYAASYDSRGRMLDAARGTLRDGSAAFNRAVAGGWKLFFLDAQSRPLIGPVRVS